MLIKTRDGEIKEMFPNMDLVTAAKLLTHRGFERALDGRVLTRGDFQDWVFNTQLVEGL